MGVEGSLEADESPAAGDVRWFCEAAAATGTEKKERKREGVERRSAEANTLAVVRTCESEEVGGPFGREVGLLGGGARA